MKEMNCNIVNDLLPLYVDGVLCEDSRKLVEEHVNECEKCREGLKKMETDIPKMEDKDIKPFKKIRRKLLVRAVLIVILLCVIAAGVFTAQMTWVPVHYAGEELMNQMEVVYLVEKGIGEPMGEGNRIGKTGWVVVIAILLLAEIILMEVWGYCPFKASFHGEDEVTDLTVDGKSGYLCIWEGSYPNHMEGSVHFYILNDGEGVVRVAGIGQNQGGEELLRCLESYSVGK